MDLLILGCLEYDLSIFISSVFIKENIGFVNVLDFRFVMDLRVLKYPEHYLTVENVCVTKKIMASITRVT